MTVSRPTETPQLGLVSDRNGAIAPEAISRPERPPWVDFCRSLGSI